MTSTIKLYNVEFELEQNARIDDLTGYLATCSQSVISNFQYVRNDLSVEIKLNLSQELVDDFPFNYCSIQNGTDDIFYYYIINSQQIAPSTIMIGLAMDTVNSLVDPRQFSKFTNIQREHIDRFYKPTHWSPSTGGGLIRRIDRQIEDYTPETILTSKIHAPTIESEPEYNWYVFYINMTVDDVQRINAYVFPQQDVQAKMTDGEVQTLNAYWDLNRYDVAIQRITLLPYCPFPHTYNSTTQVYTFDYDEAGVEIEQIRLASQQSTTIKGLRWYVASSAQSGTANYIKYPFKSKVYRSWSAGEIGMTDDKDINNESKLLQHQFHQEKMVYDSFAKEINLDDIDLSNVTLSAQLPENLPVEFKVTTLTSGTTLGFKLNSPNSNIRFIDREDFDRLLLARRNNDLAINTSAYNEYMHSDYHYDQKALALQSEQQALSLVSNVAGLALGFGPAIGGMTNGGMQLASAAQRVVNAQALPDGPVSARGIIGSAKMMQTKQAEAAYRDVSTKFSDVAVTNLMQSGIGALTNITSLATQRQAAENAILQKMDRLKLQSVSTSGSEDVEMMKWYSDNRLWIMQYDMNEQLKQQTYRIFDYFGYSHQFIEKPDVDSRIWYNYIQCTPHINRDTLGKLKQNWLQDLKAKYELGVTVFHKNTIDNTDTWDFDRQYENYETWIVEGT